MMTNDASNETQQPPEVQVDKYPSDAHYYEIRDKFGKKRAALTVVLSMQKRVLHAELVFIERYRALEPTQTEIFERAKAVVQRNYLGSGFESELVVIDGKPIGEEEVKHDNPDPIYQAPRLLRVWKVAMVYAAVLLFFVLYGVIDRLVIGPAAPEPVAVTVVDVTPPEVSAAPPATGEQPSAANASASALAATIDPLSLQPNTNGLPPSQRANPRIEVGMTVQILPGYRSFVRTEAGPDAGEAVGLLENGATANILGGPIWMPGNSDTIVWWYVETDGNIRGWTPANTSELTLLEPVE